jgi:predicted HTH domain antitoxin
MESGGGCQSSGPYGILLKSHDGTLQLYGFAMQFTIKVPDEIAEGLGSDAEVPRRVLEALVLQRYLIEEISLGRLAELLNLGRMEAEEFLDRNNARLPYTREMLEEDRRNLAEVFSTR